jgi:hypothetical protein
MKLKIEIDVTRGGSLKNALKQVTEMVLKSTMMSADVTMDDGADVAFMIENEEVKNV